MNTTLLELARSTFGHLTEAEERLFKQTAAGVMSDHSASEPAANDPAGADRWPVSRVLAAERVSWLATHAEAAKFVTHRGIVIKGARIDGRLDLQAANTIFGIYLDHCVVPAGMNLQGAEIFALNLTGTHTGRITADGIKVEGGVFLRDGFKSAGRVRLIGAQIGANLDCSGGTFLATEGETLVADGVKVEGSVLLSQRFRSEGEVRLLGATIQGNLSCEHGRFQNPGKVALGADRVHVRGNVFLSDGFLGVGRVALTSASIEGFFVWRNVDRPGETSLDLRSARIGTLGFGRESWPAAGKLLLHGLVYETIDDQSAFDSRTWIEWLRLQPERPFRPQPYEQLAAVLRSNGQDTDSKHVQYAKEIDRGRRSDLSWSQVPWYRIFGPLIGYGYKPWRAVWVSVAIVLLGSAVFGLGGKYGLMIPARSEAFETRPDGTRVVSADYPTIDPFMFSLDAFTPLISLDQAEYWRPAANRGARLDVGPVHVTTGQLLQWFLWFHVISGWVLSTLLFVGLTGTVPGT